MQLLKLVEEKTYRRLGEVNTRKSYFKLICATNKRLKEEVAKGRFRSDLYFRINVFPITMQPLRERLEDIPGLAYEILNELGASDADVPADMMESFLGYHWPGNIRELRNVLERAMILSGGRALRTEHFRGIGLDLKRPSEKGANNFKEIEKKHIKDVVKRHGGDVRKASEELGISRSTIYRKLKKP
jgi:transcriptional regulator with PAS, ATPase and Fis domain